MTKPKPTIEEATKLFGKAHAEEADAKKRMEKYKKLFYDLIVIPDEELARQSLWLEKDVDPQAYVAALYPKWRIVTVDQTLDEQKVIIEEDPTKKTFQFVNPEDGKVYTRTVAESAPDVDLERLALDNSQFWWDVTFQPKPPRELRPLDELTEEQLEKLRNYLLPPKLTNRMEKPRPAKPEELEDIDCVHPHAIQDERNESTWFCPDCEETFLP